MINEAQHRPTIYLADDDADDRELLFHAFRQITDRHHLKLAGNGKALIDMLSHIDDRELPCLIVLDYNMPGLNGKDTLRYLQDSKRYRHIPKVIYSTSDSFVDKAEFLSIGAREFIIKADSIRGILTSARKMLAYCEVEVTQPA
jgi:CheY-like chemotaxis protein